jgi:chromosome segregation ATPase
MTKRSDDAQHENDTSAITDFSNQLTSAKAKLINRDETLIVLSNNLSANQSAALTFSNQLAEAQSTLVLGAEQITNLTRQVAQMTLEKKTLDQHAMDLTNQMTMLTSQMAGLTNQNALARASLDQAYKDYSLLENRLRRDVAERLVVERKFNNPSELQTQMEKLKKNPAETISAESIYAGLDVEVKSNAFHVILPN